MYMSPFYLVLSGIVPSEQPAVCTADENIIGAPKIWSDIGSPSNVSFFRKPIAKRKNEKERQTIANVISLVERVITIIKCAIKKGSKELEEIKQTSLGTIIFKEQQRNSTILLSQH